MATVRSIISDALQEIGVLAGNETASADMAAICLLRFRNQLDSWAAESLTLASLNKVSFALTPGTSTYTIGDGADIDVQRPVWITRINYQIPGTTIENLGGLAQWDDEAYAAQPIKDLSGSLPQAFWYNASTPFGTLVFWPVVNQAVTVVLYLPTATSADITLNTDIQGPPGYQEAFMYQLAKRLCTPFGRVPPPLLLENIAEATARFKRPNLKPGLMGVDAALVPTFGGYNILTDATNASR